MDYLIKLYDKALQFDSNYPAAVFIQSMLVDSYENKRRMQWYLDNNPQTEESYYYLALYYEYRK